MGPIEKDGVKRDITKHLQGAEEGARKLGDKGLIRKIEEAAEYHRKHEDPKGPPATGLTVVTAPGYRWEPLQEEHKGFRPGEIAPLGVLGATSAAPSALQPENRFEQCSYCGVAYPAPVSLHHSLPECDLARELG